MPRKGKKKKWSFEEWQPRERKKKTQELIGKRRKKGAEKNAAAIVVFALRKSLRDLIDGWHKEATETTALVRISALDDVITRAPQHQDAVAKLISETPSVMLFLEFLISQASEGAQVSRNLFYQATIEEVCILVEGYQTGLREGLDVGQHIIGIPESENDAMALWERLADDSDDQEDDLEDTGS